MGLIKLNKLGTTTDQVMSGSLRKELLPMDPTLCKSAYTPMKVKPFFTPNVNVL